MGYWKDQLEKLSKRLGSKQKGKAPRSQNIASASQSSGEIPKENADWKAGVKPLSNRKERVVKRAGRQTPIGQTQSSKQSKTPAVAQAASGHHHRQEKVPSAELDPENRPGSKKSDKRSFAASTATLFEGTIEKPPAASLSRHNHFRFPAAWVEQGCRLQASGGNEGRLLSIRIGIDFGTAYSKVAVRIADSVFIVDFGGVSSAGQTPLLLPGEVSEDGNGWAWLGQLPGGDRVISGLKLPFISASTASMESKAAATVFLAWIMRYVRAWVFRHHATLIAGRRLAWEVNLGMPSSSWADQSLKSRYKKVALSAWKMSQEPQVPCLARARELLRVPLPMVEEIGLDDLQLIPEFVAQLAGYVMSPQRPEKGNELHLLVDIGAGTVDIACFGAYRPHKGDCYKYPTWASSVLPLGTHYLMEARNLAIKGVACSWNDMSNIPSAEEFAKESGGSDEHVQEIDHHFSGRVSAAIGQVLTQTKSNRNPLAREWQGGIRTFLAGGGAHCEVYRCAVSRSLKRLRTPIQQMRFHLHEMEGNHAIGEELAHRLSVAYGLTFDAISIGEAVLPQDIQDFRLSRDPIDRPDRDELYPK